MLKKVYNCLFHFIYEIETCPESLAYINDVST